MNKNVLITGASSGIGEACAYEFASNKYNLILAARNEEKLLRIKQKISSEFSVKVSVVALDLTEKDAALKLKETLDRQGISVDILINNAGYGDLAPFLDSDWEKQRRMVELNIEALMHTTYVFGNDMKKRGFGHIVNISSLAAFFSGPYMAVYYASKAFVLSFSEAVAEELKDSGVRVTAVCMGPTSTGFEKAANLDEHSNMFKKLKPALAEDVAKTVYKSCLKRKAVSCHGAVTKLACMANGLLPRKLKLKITKNTNGKPK